ncbi:4-(cytidine 5'-diphospho)-2-C-methyl-D-erythritol kinase [Tepidicaulis sp.]|uniref:4-(cytidine 5'-diphospho)-2-C-methyl-D-erythritol kinase n=1 Tax=Tepidicaulis sp. TaxID=1920809 RepID=UPI003B58DFBD
MPAAAPDPAAIEEAAPAKINLTLEILGRRTDGYHELASLVVFAEAGDRLWAAPSDTLTLEVEGSFAGSLSDEDNLVLKAAKLLQEKAGVTAGAALKLEKNLPVASGIGGGSADAAATLRALNRLWALGLSPQDLAGIGKELGADVPVCIESRSAFMTGIGERLSPVALPDGLHLLLVNCGTPLSTGSVFKELGAGAYDGRGQDAPEPFDNFREFADWLAEHDNDLQGAAVSLLPELEEVLGAIRVQPGCHLARMSGSGATCFGLFDDAGRLEKAAARLADARPNWWCRPAAIL